jgi:DNA-binding transcriptional LysR family regulator
VLLRHPGGRRPPELTDTGRVVLAHAEPLLARVKAAQSDVASVVPRLTVDVDDPRVAVHDLPDLPPRQLVAMWHRDRHLGATTRAFLDAATEICGGWAT